VDQQLITPTVGWVLTSNALLITEDRGAHWANITPSGAKPTYGETENGIKGVVFNDAEHGWVATAVSYSSPYSATVTLLSTGDAGRRWRVSGHLTVPLQYCLCGVTIDAVDGSNLWLDIDVGTKADGWGRDILERSVDGGSRWQRVDIPTSGQLLFSDRLDGIVAGGSPSIFDYSGDPHDVAAFYATHDGGVHWDPLVLTPAPPAPAPTATDPYTAYAIAGGLAIAYVQSVTSASTVYVYSNSHGLTWSRVATVESGDFPDLTVISRTTWLLDDLGDNATQPRLRITDNSGMTWQTLAPVPDPVPGNTGVTLDFAGAVDGWAFTSSNFCLSFKSDCGVADHLYATGDGGLTWRLVEVPGPPP